VTNAKNIGKHNLSFCNDGQFPVDLPPERILQALPDLPMLDVAEAITLMRLAYSRNWKFSIARYAEYALIIVGAVASGGATAVFVISAKGLSKIIAAIGIMHVVGDKLKGEVPPLEDFVKNALIDTIHLGPAGSINQCARRVAFTGIIHGVHGYNVVVQVPVAPAAAIRVAEVAPAPAQKPIQAEEVRQLVASAMSLALFNN